MSVQTRPAASRVDALAVGTMVLLCTVWAVQQVAGKVALSEGIPPILQALIRSAVAGPLVVAWLALRRGRRGVAALFAADGTLWPGALAASLFAIEFVLLFEGIKLSSASRAVIILYTAAFFTALGGHLLLPNERLRPINALGLLLAFAGVAATIGGGESGSALGDALVLGAAAAWGFTTVVIKASRALMAASAEKVLAYQLLGSIPVLLIVAWASGELIVPHATALAWLSLLYQCVIVAFASYLTWFWLISRYPAGRLAAFSFLTPLFGVLAAALLLGEPVTPMLLVGLACVGVGLRLVNR
jgi:drug/metabolite transporter (DMT)-like permease